jgi:alpha-tubulin suppressor-like RCC1 family protein
MSVRAFTLAGLVAGAMAAGAFVPSAPAFVATATASLVTAGHAHSCALLTSGAVKCWGSNDLGQLGDGTQTSSVTPVDTAGLTDAVVLSAAYAHTCAVTSAGAAKCWGYNLHGEIGNGSPELFVTTPSTPTGLGSGVASVASGNGHSCALLTNGGVQCWGYNAYGQLGDGTTTDRATPVSVSGLSGVTAIAVGRRQSCAITSGGDVLCWGLNTAGQLGVGTQTGPETCDGIACSRTPVAVPGVSGAASIMSGGFHTCAVTPSGGAKCWGANTNGQVGDGTFETRTSPVDVAGLTSGVAAIATGGLHTCAITSGGGAKCWGRDADGELGDGATSDSNVPVDVSGLASGVASLGLGYNHSCAVLDGGGVRCWGRNQSGQLGDGTTEGSSVPVEVVGLGGAPPFPGDVNCDKSVTSIDAALLLQLGAGLVAEVPCRENADIDSNGAINAVDAALVLQDAAGLI